MRGSNRRNLRFLHGSNDQIMPRFYRERCVLVSESFARRYHVAAGESLNLPTPSGHVAFPIAGVFYDYTNDQGTVFLSAKNFRELWHDDRVNSVAVYLQNDASPQAVADTFRKRFSHRGEFSIYSNRALRKRIFEIFDQTFAVTYVLRTIAVVVAVVGIFLGLTTLVAERSRELGVLRSIGASAKQVRRLLLWESGMIGLLASALGIASGLCLARCPHRRDQSRVFRLDDPARFSLGLARLDAALDCRRGHRRGMDSGLARGPAQCRGGVAERMKRIANVVGGALALLCVAAEWKIAEPGDVTSSRAIITCTRISKPSGGISPAT